MTWVTNGSVRWAGRLAVAMMTTALGAALAVPAALASPESDAADAISAAWNAAGGSDSVVGSQDGEVYQVGAGYGQKFTDGAIFFTPDTGAHLIYGAILDKYQSLGGPGDSDLGFPTIDEVPGLIGPDSRVSTFSASDKPAIFWTPDTGAWSVRGAINAAWDKLGGSSGTLGVPTEDERYDGDVVSQKFTGGELSWDTATKTFTTVPAELAENLAGLEVPLDATTQINQAWRASGGLGGPLGARQGEQARIGDNGAAQGYAGGKIFFTPETGAHALTGAILSKYESTGGPTGDLGLPTGSETDGGAPNSRVSTFNAPDNPVIFWTPDAGAIIVRGAMNAAWDKLGGAAGILGVPSGEETVSGDTVTQKFSGGEIAWNRVTKQFSTKPTGLAADLKGLQMPDAVAQTPAGGSEGESGSGFTWHWWWLAILIPLLALAGLLVSRSRRGGTGADGDGGYRGHGEGFGEGYDERYGEGYEQGYDQRYDRPYGGRHEEAGSGWSAPDFDSDEDRIDTAPTRIPTEAELADFGAADSGRHSADDDGPAPWQFDLGDLDRPRHRRAAAEEPETWTGTGEFVEVAEERFEPEVISDDDTYGAAYRGDYGTPAQDFGDEEAWHPAIHLPLADPFEAPEGYFIKANTHSGLYYTPDSVLYESTVPEVWFASEDVAQANGFVRAPE